MYGENRTLIVTLEGKDGLLLAADSRGTIGDPRSLTAINDSHRKLFKLSKYCGIGVAGSSELAAKMIDELVRKLQDQKVENIDPILTETRNLVRVNYNDWFSQFPVVPTRESPTGRPVLTLTIIGYNRDNSNPTNFLPRIYLLSSQLDFAPQLCPSGYMLSGVPQYATYLLHRLYDREMTVKHLASLAVYLISETATQDPKVGGPIRVAEITPEEGYRELSSKIISDIQKRNERQNQKLRKFFFEGKKK